MKNVRRQDLRCCLCNCLCSLPCVCAIFTTAAAADIKVLMRPTAAAAAATADVAGSWVGGWQEQLRDWTLDPSTNAVRYPKPHD